MSDELLVVRAQLGSRSALEDRHGVVGELDRSELARPDVAAPDPTDQLVDRAEIVTRLAGLPVLE